MGTELKAQGGILGWGKYEFAILWLFFLLWGAVFLDRLVMSFLAPMAMADLNISDQTYGLINTFTTGCYAISAIFITPIMERTGKRKKWLVLLALGAGVFAIVGAATQTGWQLLITRAIVGFCEGPIAPIIFAMLLKESTPARYAINAGIINMGVSIVAILIGARLVTTIAVATTWRMGFLVAGIISVIVTLIIIAVVKEVPFIPEEKKESLGTVFKQLLKNRNVVICFILGIMTMCIYWTQMLYATLFFTSVGNDMTRAGAIVSFTGLLGIMWVLVVPKISDFMGRKPALMMWFAVCAIAPMTMFGAPSSGAAVIVYILFASIPGAIFPFFQAIIPGESLPNHMLGTASGLIIGCSEIIGGSAWPAFAGMIAGSGGGHNYPPVILVAGCAAIAAIIITIFLKETRKKAEKPVEEAGTAK